MANALTDAKARGLHPAICKPPLPAGPAARIRDIANAIVPPEALEQARVQTSGGTGATELLRSS